MAAVAAVAGIISAATPAAAAAYPTSSFTISFGASYYTGTVTWYNRSVGVDGTFRASNCRRIYAEAWAGDTYLDTKNSSTWCNQAAAPASLPLDADIAGGANQVDIWMTTEDPHYYLDVVTCYRGVSCKSVARASRDDSTASSGQQLRP